MLCSVRPTFGPEAVVTQRTAKRRLHRPEDDSLEFERDAVRTMRLVRILIYCIFGILAVVGVLLVLGVAAGVAFGGHAASGVGSDQHADLKAGEALHASTEAGTTGDVTILNVEQDATSLTVTAKVQGMAGTPPGAWQVYLWGDTRAPMTAQQISSDKGGEVVRASVELPPGSAAEFVQFNPDSSHGDLYFDVPR